MKELEVISYLLSEIEEAQQYKEGYEERLLGAKKYASEMNTWLSLDILKLFDIENQPDNATIRQNAKKIRKLLLKLY